MMKTYRVTIVKTAFRFTVCECVHILVLEYVLVCVGVCMPMSQGTEQTQTPLKSERLKGWRGNPRTSQAQRGNCLEP